MEKTERERLGRFSVDPLIGAEGKPIEVRRPTTGDLEKLKALARHRFLNCRWLAALTDSSADWVVNRFNVLKREPNCWVKVAEPILNEQKKWLSLPLFYELTSRSIEYLAERGLVLPKRYPIKNFQHQAMTDQIMASLEIGIAAASGIRLIPWDEIRERKGIDSHRISTEYRRDNHVVKKEVSADDRPVGIERTIDGKTSYIFLFGPETDCGTEPLRSYDYERSSIHGKMLAYLSIIANHDYKQLGLKNLFFPFYAPTTRRMESMMQLLSHLTDGKGSPNILFATHPLIFEGEQLQPSGKVFTQPYKRVGHSDFYLDR